MLELYERIKERRKALGISQQELAELTGYTDRSSIAKIEKGEVDLPQSRILAFAQALNTTTTDLMGDDGKADFEQKIKAVLKDEDGEVVEEVVEIIVCLLDLPADRRREALNYLRYLSTKSDNP